MSGEPPLLVPFSALKAMGIDLSRDTIRRLARSGRFPSPRRVIGGHKIFFIEAEVRAWIEALPVAGPRVRRISGSLSKQRKTSDERND
jgi:predicted DNA-binding transcriptional regulator AlpA